MTLENAKLLVKLLSPETANIRNIFDQKTLLYTKMVRDRNNVEAKVSKLKMATEAEDILDKVDNIMENMRTYPVADIKEEFLENILLAGWLVRLDSLMNDVRQFYWWFDKYDTKMDKSLKFQVYHKTSKMEEDYEVYSKKMLEKHRLFKNKNQNVQEKKPEESNSEVDDLAEGQASHEAAKDTKMRTDLQACIICRPILTPSGHPKFPLHQVPAA